MINQKVLLKDILFNQTKIEQIANEIYLVHPSFKMADFIRDVVVAFPELELKERISWISECLNKYLPSDYRHTVSILVRALPPPNNPTLTDNDFGDFIYAPYAEYIAKNGCTREYLQISFKALYEITQRFSVENAIRYFINAYPEEALHELSKWATDSHYHVRRLCSEGTRPKLPWAQKISIPVFASLTILDELFFDKTRFVTRSVANHLNDISKVSPDLVIDTLKKWRKSNKQNQPEMEYITHHALRTLIKNGHPKALQFIGLSHIVRVYVSQFVIPKKVNMNTSFEFSFVVLTKEDTDVIIDYILYFQNKSGKLNSKKVFKLKSISLKKNQPVAISKRHVLRQFMTTRTLYAGRHEIELQINGKLQGKHIFELV